MGQTVHLFLEIDGNAIEGESTRNGLDREGSIECLSFSMFCQESKTRPEPITFEKNVDNSTTPILNALFGKDVVINAEFRFYRKSHTGHEEHFQSIFLDEGRIVDYDQSSMDLPPFDGTLFNMVEAIKISYKSLRGEYITTGGEVVYKNAFDI